LSQSTHLTDGQTELRLTRLRQHSCSRGKDHTRQRKQYDNYHIRRQLKIRKWNNSNRKHTTAKFKCYGTKWKQQSF